VKLMFPSANDDCDRVEAGSPRQLGGVGNEGSVVVAEHIILPTVFLVTCIIAVGGYERPLPQARSFCLPTLAIPPHAI